jgi:AraC-like DNA-binding protein
VWNGKTRSGKLLNQLDHELECLPDKLVAAVNNTCRMEVPHWHAQVEINFIYSGGMSYRMSNYAVNLGAGDLCMFWGGQPHQAIDVQPGTELVAIHLPLVHFFRLRLSADLMQRLTRGGAVVTGTQGLGDVELFRRLTDYMNGEDGARRTYAIEELLTRLNRLTFEPHRIIDGDGDGEASGEPLDATAFRNIIEICAYITENFRDDIGSAEIASSLDIHPKYAMSVFKKSTGMTLNEYLTLIRLSYAQSLLLADDANILDVALDSGFGSLSAFTQSFRKVTRQSPSDFRRQRASYMLAV